MNVSIKTRYVFEVSSKELTLILKALEKHGGPALELRSALLTEQRPQLEKLVTTFTTIIQSTAKESAE